jgi:hypothetical protein
MTIPEAVGAVIGGGLTASGLNAILARLLIASWLRELDAKFVAIETRFADAERSAAKRADENDRRFSMIALEKKEEELRVQAAVGDLLKRLEKLSNQLSYLNGQLAARGLTKPPDDKD